MNDSGYVSLQTIAGFRKVMELSGKFQDILEALKDSKEVVVDAANLLIRPAMTFERKTIILRDVPAETTEEEIRGLFAILDRMKRGQPRFELMSVGHQFHLSLAQLAHHRVLDGCYLSAASQMRSMRVLESRTLEVYRSGIHEHAAIAEAIAHRDGALAAQRMREHLQNDYGPYLSELTAPQL